MFKKPPLTPTLSPPRGEGEETGGAEFMLRECAGFHCELVLLVIVRAIRASPVFGLHGYGLFPLSVASVSSC